MGYSPPCTLPQVTRERRVADRPYLDGLQMIFKHPEIRRVSKRNPQKPPNRAECPQLRQNASNLNEGPPNEGQGAQSDLIPDMGRASCKMLAHTDILMPNAPTTTTVAMLVASGNFSFSENRRRKQNLKVGGKEQ